MMKGMKEKGGLVGTLEPIQTTTYTIGTTSAVDRIKRVFYRDR